MKKIPALLILLLLCVSVAYAQTEENPVPADAGDGGTQNQQQNQQTQGQQQQNPPDPNEEEGRSGTYKFEPHQWSWTTNEGDTYYLPVTTINGVTYWDMTRGADYPSGIYGVSVLRDVETGDVTYMRDGKPLTGEDLQKFLADNKDALTRVNSDADKNKNVFEQLRWQRLSGFGEFVSEFVDYYKQYSGLAGWSALIFDEEDLKEWRERVNTIMCDKLHLPTKECWVSKICMRHAEIKPTKNGVLFSSAFGAVPRGIAHVEGQRSLPVTLPNETKWGYTITFGLSNPTGEDMTYNMHFIGNQRTSYWWSTPQGLGEGNTIGYIGASALYKISNTDYHSVCLTFDPQITAADGKRVGRICNSIMQYSGGATAPYPVAENETITTGPAGTAPGPQAPLPPGATI